MADGAVQAWIDQYDIRPATNATDPPAARIVGVPTTCGPAGARRSAGAARGTQLRGPVRRGAAR